MSIYKSAVLWNHKLNERKEAQQIAREFKPTLEYPFRVVGKTARDKEAFMSPMFHKDKKETAVEFAITLIDCIWDASIRRIELQEFHDGAWIVSRAWPRT